MKTVSTSINGTEVTISGEGVCAPSTLNRYRLKHKTGLHLISHQNPCGTFATALRDGKQRWVKHKHRLTDFEIAAGHGAGQKKYLYEDQPSGLRILDLICAEMLFPEDYWSEEDVDLIVHHVGFQMADEHQWFGWKAMQKALTLHFDCPLLCCVGNENAGDLVLTGLVDARHKPAPQSFDDLALKEFDNAVNIEARRLVNEGFAFSMGEARRLLRHPRIIERLRSSRE